MVALYYATSPITFIFIAVVYGIGFGTMTSSCQALCVVNAAPERRGMANSTYYLGIDFGMGLGSYLAGTVAGAKGYSNKYLFGSIPLILGLIVFIFGGSIKLKPVKKEYAVGYD